MTRLSLLPFALALAALPGCAADNCQRFVDAWNACSASDAGTIGYDTCAEDVDSSATACAADAAEAADCSTEEGRTAMVAAVSACGVSTGGSGGSDTSGGGYDTGW